MSETIKLSKLKPNPDNPRTIRDKRFELMVENLIRYPKFLEQRPIVHKDFIAIGGNMRTAGLKHIVKMEEAAFNQLCHKLMLDADIHEMWLKIRKEKAIPAIWLADAANYSEDETKAFIIVDNVSFGENDWDKLANEWDEEKLTEWGMEINWNSNKKDDLLPIDPAPSNHDEFDTPSSSSKPSPLDDKYTVFEQIMDKDNKNELLELLNEIRTEHNLEKLEDALMHLVKTYKKNHKPKK